MLILKAAGEVLLAACCFQHRGRRMGLLFGILVLLVLGGCASTPQSDQVLACGATADRPLPTRMLLDDVPFYPQEALQCGPASLAMGLSHLPGPAVNPEDILSEVYTPGRKGSLQTDLISAARRHGALAYVIRPDLRVLLREVAAGHPVIILQNLAFNWYPKWHYAVVIGFDLDRGDLILHSGREQRQTMPMRVFERTWARGGRWGLLVLKPGELPANPDEPAYLNAALGLEKAGQWQAAAQAYGAALLRWPASVGAALGLGNSRYAAGDLPGAAAAFEAGLAQHPDSAVLHNNLAQTLLDQGRSREALQHAQKAVALQPDTAAFQDTLAQARKAASRRAGNS